MELWIRSQNKKKLIKVDMIEIDKQIEGPAIIFSHEYTLGEYDSKERALEVLDEIQKRLALPNYDVTKNTYSQYDKLIESKTYKESLIYVYEMPKE